MPVRAGREPANLQLTPSMPPLLHPERTLGRGRHGASGIVNNSSFKIAGRFEAGAADLENNAVRRFLLVVGALAIVATSFFVTLQILKSFDTPPAPLTPLQARDAVRVQQVRTIKAALERYKADHGSYPVLPENDASDLQPDLVGGGYLTEMPKAPGPAGGKNGPLYSSNGKNFGLFVNLEAGAPGIPAGSGCLARANGDHSSKFWGDPPDCPF